MALARWVERVGEDAGYDRVCNAVGGAAISIGHGWLAEWLHTGGINGD